MGFTNVNNYLKIEAGLYELTIVGSVTGHCAALLIQLSRLPS